MLMRKSARSVIEIRAWAGRYADKVDPTIATPVGPEKGSLLILLHIPG